YRQAVLSSLDSEVRRFGAQALRGRGAEGFAKAYPDLLRLSRDPDAGVREEVALIWSHLLPTHPMEIRELVRQAFQALAEFGMDDPTQRYGAILLHLIAEALKSFSVDHLDWTVELLNQGARVQSLP